MAKRKQEEVSTPEETAEAVVASDTGTVEEALEEALGPVDPPVETPPPAPVTEESVEAQNARLKAELDMLKLKLENAELRAQLALAAKGQLAATPQKPDDRVVASGVYYTTIPRYNDGKYIAGTPENPKMIKFPKGTKISNDEFAKGFLMTPEQYKRRQEAAEAGELEELIPPHAGNTVGPAPHAHTKDKV